MKNLNVWSMIVSVIALLHSIHIKIASDKSFAIYMAAEQTGTKTAGDKEPWMLRSKPVQSLPGLESRSIFATDRYLKIELAERLVDEHCSFWDKGTVSNREWYEKKGPKAHPIAKKLFEINGVDSVEIDQYTIVIRCGELFSWEKLSPQIGKVLDEELPQPVQPKQPPKTVSHSEKMVADVSVR